MQHVRVNNKKMEEEESSLKTILKEIEEEEKEVRLVADASYLDTLKFPSTIIGRQDKLKEIARFLVAFKKGDVVPFISAYGRSRSGKSTIVKLVCENIPSVFYTYVNLRKARTVFGCTNIILSQLGQPQLKNAQGINTAIERIGNSIGELVKRKEKEKENCQLFVLILGYC